MASIAMDISDDDNIEEDSHEYMRPGDFLAFALLLDFTGYILADRIEQEATAITADDIIPSVGVVGASDDDSKLAAALVTVEAPSSDDDGHGCYICLEDDDGTAVWKETTCGHRFHGRCVERWLHAKGSCPMCRRQLLVVTTPTADATDTAAYLELVRTVRFIFEAYGQDGVNSTFVEEE